MPLSELDSILFGLNALAYIFLFVWFWYKDRQLNLRTFITLLYAGSAIFAPYVYTAIDEKFYLDVTIGHITLMPFVYLFAVYLLILSPILHGNIQNVKEFYIPNPRLLNGLTWVVVGIYAITIATTTMEITDLFSLEKLMQNYADTIENTIDGYKVDVSLIERITSIIKGATTDLVILLLIYHIINENKIGIILMFMCIGYTLLYNLSIGQRAIILETIFNIVFIFLAIRHTMPERIRRRFTISLAIFGVITLMAFGALTFARFSDRDTSVMTYVLTYYSESWYIFDNHGLDPGGCRYGDFTAPLVRRVLGLPCTKTMFDSIDTFVGMNSNCSVFNTVVGDFTMDIGVIWTVILFIFYAVFMHSELKNEDEASFPFSKLIILIIAWRIASIGFISFSYRGIGGNLQLVTDIVLYMLLKRKYVLAK